MASMEILFVHKAPNYMEISFLRKKTLKIIFLKKELVRSLSTFILAIIGIRYSYSPSTLTATGHK
jgi:hypothetical protein